MPNSVSAILYPKGADLNQVCQSLRIIIQDLELQKGRRTEVA
jgi:hypothetical protein